MAAAERPADAPAWTVMVVEATPVVNGVELSSAISVQYYTLTKQADVEPLPLAAPAAPALPPPSSADAPADVPAEQPVEDKAVPPASPDKPPPPAPSAPAEVAMGLEQAAVSVKTQLRQMQAMRDDNEEGLLPAPAAISVYNGKTLTASQQQGDATRPSQPRFS